MLSEKKQKVKPDKILEDIYGGAAMATFNTQIVAKKKAIEPITSSSGGTSSFSPGIPGKNKWVTSKIYPTAQTLSEGTYFICPY